MSRPAGGGYTLIEAVIVVFVLSLAAALVAPSVGRGAAAIRRRAEVAAVASFLRIARERAISQHVPLEVELDAEGRTLVVRARGPDGLPAASPPRAVRRLSPLVHLEAEPPQARTVTFFPYGLSSGGRFRLEAAGAAPYLVTVDPLTGRIATRRGAS